MMRFFFGAAVGAGLMYGYLFHFQAPTEMPSWMKGAAAGYNDRMTRERIEKDGLK